jgi:hypothetical protein
MGTQQHRILTPDLRRQTYLREKAMEPTPLLPRHLPPRPRSSAQDNRTPVQIAEAAGYKAGLWDRQWTEVEYRTGAEYIAWYKGWKQGQARLQSRRADPSSQPCSQPEFNN